MILVFGSNGQLGKRICRQLESFGLKFSSLSRDDFDFTDSQKVREAIRTLKPEVILNCSGFTNVAGAEKQLDMAYYINAVLPQILCEEQKKNFGTIIHFSTDYVFDGRSNNPYTELCEPRPINVYGQTKLAGEHNIKHSRVPYFIFRIGWVYSSDESSFVMRVANKLAKEDCAKVVVDQFGTPNSADWIALKVCELLSNHKKDFYSFIKAKSGIYHLSANGHTSWYDFALKISSVLKRTKNKFREVGVLFSSDSIFSSIKRPSYSVLNNSKSKSLFKTDFPDWQTLFLETMSPTLGVIEVAEKKVFKKPILPDWQEELENKKQVKVKKRKTKWRG